MTDSKEYVCDWDLVRSTAIGLIVARDLPLEDSVQAAIQIVSELDDEIAQYLLTEIEGDQDENTKEK
jgi:hypothetical protein